MSFDNTLNVYFVNTGSTEPSGSGPEEMDTALTYLRNHMSEEHIRQIKASEGFPLIASGQLTKKDVFVFDKFEGNFFTQLQQTKALIIGPRCLISCLLNCKPIPLGTSPVYTTAMRDLQICATGISVAEKDQLRKLVQWMGGYYFLNLGRSITHLVSNTIKSTKYEHATLNGIPVMHVDWVQRVWERSCVDNVMATDEEFDKYRLPIFFGTNITCTGLEGDKKNEIMRLVNENGGTFHRAFRSTHVDILITEKNQTSSDKYKAAVRYKKDILSPEWIFDSVQKGFALPTKAYMVKSIKVSTPTKTDRSIADFTHLSDLSRISCVRPSNNNSTVNETLSAGGTSGNNFVTPSVPPSKDLHREVLKKHGAGEHYRLVYEEISPKEAKKAGNFLDGCCIYLSGFRLEEKEKLNRILNVGGATRYDVVNDKITHIIVGQLEDAELRAWKKDGWLTSLHVVRLDWLLQSIKLKQPASEVVYRMSLPSTREPDAPSPSSKKTLRSMNHSFKPPDVPKKRLFEDVAKQPSETAAEPPLASSTELPFEAEEHNLIAQYSQENVAFAEMPAPSNKPSVEQTLMPPIASSTLKPVTNPANNTQQPPATETTESAMSCIDYENLDFFRDMAVYVDKLHFPDEFYTQMISECQAAHGNVVSSTFKDTVDYAIVSFERTLDVTKLPVKARHVITELYVESCLKENKLVPIEYYHKHVPDTAASLPLTGMTIVVSIYAGLERDFIESIAQLLGANVNKTFAKKEKPLLVCSRPEGSKYEGAIKWSYPVVSSEWLVQCAQQGEKLPFQPYLVGESPANFPVSPAQGDRKSTETPARSAPMDVDGVENNPLHSADHTDFTPLRNKRVCELAGGPRKSLPHSNNNDSPHTPTNNYARPTYNFDYMENILASIEDEDERNCIRELITEMRQNQTPELERIRRQACTPINRKVPTPKGIPDFCTTPEFQRRMADEFERRWRLPTKKLKPDTPIDEVCRRAIRVTCEALGIPYVDDSNANAASTSKSANQSKTLTEVPRARTTETPRNAGHIVPRSIFATTPKQQVTRKNDTLIPSTQTPTHEGTVGVSMGIGERVSLGNKSSTINFDKISFEETEVEAHASSKSNSKLIGRVSQSASASASPEIQKIADYLKNCESRRHSLKRMNEGNAGQVAVDGNKESARNSATNTEAHHFVQPFESEQFGAGTEEMVGWHDPMEFSKERRSKVKPTMQHKGVPRFSISCADEELRNDTINKIQQLGGLVSENLNTFDPECSHLVCERPNRGEKMLGCISSGKWVLSLKYIEECYAKDVFIDEELFEWGNTKALNMPQLTQDEQVIAHAVHRWRKELASSEGKVGAFDGFRVILRISERNIDALKNVIRAGKGEIIEATLPLKNHSEVLHATHCFVDMKKAPLTKEDFDYLESVGVLVYTQMYINAYLMYGKEMDEEKYKIKM